MVHRGAAQGLQGDRGHGHAAAPVLHVHQGHARAAQVQIHEETTGDTKAVRVSVPYI